jgi:hypothetical protein
LRLLAAAGRGDCVGLMYSFWPHQHDDGVFRWSPNLLVKSDRLSFKLSIADDTRHRSEVPTLYLSRSPQSLFELSVLGCGLFSIFVLNTFELVEEARSALIVGSNIEQPVLGGTSTPPTTSATKQACKTT